MRTGFATSVAVHAALLSWGLWSLSAPKALDATYAEALPVEVVMADQFEGVKGDAKAPLKQKPAPTPTTKPAKLPMDAKNVGDNETDLETPPVPTEKPVTEAAKPQPKKADPPPPPPPKPEPKVADATPPKPAEPPKPEPPKPEPPKPEPKTAEVPKPTPTPPKPEPKPEPTPPKDDPLAEAIKTAEKTPPPKEVTPPKPVAKPEVKPTPPKPEAAKKPEDAKKAPEPKEKPTKPTETASNAAPTDAKVTDAKSKEKSRKADSAAKPSSDASEFNADDIAAMLDKKKAAGGGAKRSTEQASLGAKTTTGTKLTRSQEGQLQGMIQDQMSKCWNPPAGIESGESLKVAIKIRFDPSGAIEGMPEITQGGGSGAQRIAAEAAVRAIRRCAPFNLPADLYAGGWEVTNLNFDPSEMF